MKLIEIKHGPLFVRDSVLKASNNQNDEQGMEHDNDSFHSPSL